MDHPQSMRCLGPLFADHNKFVYSDGRLQFQRVFQDHVPTPGLYGPSFRWDKMLMVNEQRQLVDMPTIEGVYMHIRNGNTHVVSKLILYTYYYGEGPKPTFEDLQNGVRARFVNRDEPGFQVGNDANYRPGNVEWFMPPTPQEVPAEADANDIDQQLQLLALQDAEEGADDPDVDHHVQLRGAEEQVIVLTAAEAFIIRGVNLQLEGAGTVTTVVVRQQRRQ